MIHLYDAQELKEQYPEETKGFSVFEIERIWEEHSYLSAAGWLIPSNPDEVEMVFSNFRTI